MAVLLFSLSGVPDDEADEVRALLDSHHIEFYETGRGILGFSTPAIWLPDEARLEQARRLIADYQMERSRSQREAYAQRQQAGEQPTIIHAMLSSPFRFVLYVAAILIVLYFSIRPFFFLGSPP